MYSMYICTYVPTHICTVCTYVLVYLSTYVQYICTYVCAYVQYVQYVHTYVHSTHVPAYIYEVRSLGPQVMSFVRRFATPCPGFCGFQCQGFN